VLNYVAGNGLVQHFSRMVVGMLGHPFFIDHSEKRPSARWLWSHTGRSIDPAEEDSAMAQHPIGIIGFSHVCIAVSMLRRRCGFTATCLGLTSFLTSN